MWWRAIVGIFLVLTGGLWILQGIGVARGSFMTGQSQWAIIGAVLVAVGVLLLGWANRIRTRPDAEADR